MAAATTQFNVSVHIDEEFADLVSAEAIAEAARRAARGERLDGRASVDVTITGDEAVRELNAAYRGRDETTDVLSFSYPAHGDAGTPASDDFALPPGEEASLGDVVVSFPQARRQAEEAGVPLSEEVAHLVTHGTLHLLGYDHDDPARDRAMRARERAALGSLFGVAGPGSED